MIPLCDSCLLGGADIKHAEKCLGAKIHDLIHNFQCRHSLPGQEVIDLLLDEAQRRIEMGIK